MLRLNNVFQRILATPIGSAKIIQMPIFSDQEPLPACKISFGRTEQSPLFLSHPIGIQIEVKPDNKPITDPVSWGTQIATGPHDPL
ncbi:MAG: hypothetical protein DRH07_09650 [Deltaproteobacteria bacterium]|nr:MAG: hypothetical protein DRH07_09650 [Deltaproteobacteria bacterium]